MYEARRARSVFTSLTRRIVDFCSLPFSFHKRASRSQSGWTVSRNALQRAVVAAARGNGSDAHSPSRGFFTLRWLATCSAIGSFCLVLSGSARSPGQREGDGREACQGRPRSSAPRGAPSSLLVLSRPPHQHLRMW